MSRSVPTTPKAEVFCNHCRRFVPRERIGAVKWIRDGKQALYTCTTCKEQIARRVGAAHGG